MGYCILFYRSMSWSTALSCKVEVEWVAQISKLGYCKGLYNEEWSVVLQRWLGMGGSNIQVGNFLGPFNREWSVKFEVFWVSSEESVVDSCCGSSVSQVFPVSIHDPYILSSFLHLQYILLQANAIVYIMSWALFCSIVAARIWQCYARGSDLPSFVKLINAMTTNFITFFISVEMVDCGWCTIKWC